jgi:hydrogenase-4 component E
MIDQTLALNIIEFLTGLIILTTFILYFSNSTHRYIMNFVTQSIFLAGLTAFIGYYIENEELYLAAGLTFIIKVVVIPQIINFGIKKIKLVEEKEPFVNFSFSLLIVGFLIILSYLVISPIVDTATVITKNILPFAVAMVLIGFFMMATKRKANTQMFGLLVMENGLYLATIATTYSMILIVELGVAIDVFIGVGIMSVFLFMMNKNLQSIDTTMLKELSE